MHQIIGSDKMTPIYAKRGTSKNTTATLPINSMAPGYQRRHHIAHALQRIAQYRNDHCDKVQHGIDAQVQRRCLDNLRHMCTRHHIYKKRNNRVCHKHNKQTPAPRQNQCSPDALCDALELPGTEILAAIGCHGCGKNKVRHHKQFRQLARRGMRNDDIGAKRVDCALQYHRTQIDQRQHKAHRKACAVHPLKRMRIVQESRKIFATTRSRTSNFINTKHMMTEINC